MNLSKGETIQYRPNDCQETGVALKRICWPSEGTQKQNRGLLGYDIS